MSGNSFFHGSPIFSFSVWHKKYKLNLFKMVFRLTFLLDPCFYQHGSRIKAEREKENQFWKGYDMFLNTKNEKTSRETKLVLAILMTENSIHF